MDQSEVSTTPPGSPPVSPNSQPALYQHDVGADNSHFNILSTEDEGQSDNQSEGRVFQYVSTDDDGESVASQNLHNSNDNDEERGTQSSAEEGQQGQGVQMDSEHTNFFNSVEVIRLQHRVSIQGAAAIYEHFIKNRQLLADYDSQGQSKPPSFKTIRRNVYRNVPPVLLNIRHFDKANKSVVLTNNVVRINIPYTYCTFLSLPNYFFTFKTKNDITFLLLVYFDCHF